MQHDASYPREEPGAGNLHARIREGESRMAELLDQFPRKKVGRTELEEDSDRWSLENSGSETRTTGKKARRLPPPSVAAIGHSTALGTTHTRRASVCFSSHFAAVTV